MDFFLYAIARRFISRRRRGVDATGARAERSIWCIFANTAQGAAAPNALSLMRQLAA
jgi:uncharacterized protein YecE (DUF72 family)